MIPSASDCSRYTLKNLPARAPDALHHRNALDLLPDEHARDARHGDAAEHDDDEADEAEIIFRALEVFADLLLAIPIRTHAHELRPQLGLEVAS